MNKEQFERAVGIIRADCEIRGLLRYEGKTCAVGALLSAAGVPDEELDGKSTLASPLHQVLYTRYGLPRAAVPMLVEANDGGQTVAARRTAVEAVLKSFCEVGDE